MMETSTVKVTPKWLQNITEIKLEAQHREQEAKRQRDEADALRRRMHNERQAYHLEQALDSLFIPHPPLDGNLFVDPATGYEFSLRGWYACTSPVRAGFKRNNIGDEARLVETFTLDIGKGNGGLYTSGTFSAAHEIGTPKAATLIKLADALSELDNTLQAMVNARAYEAEQDAGHAERIEILKATEADGICLPNIYRVTELSPEREIETVTVRHQVWEAMYDPADPNNCELDHYLIAGWDIIDVAYTSVYNPYEEGIEHTRFITLQRRNESPTPAAVPEEKPASVSGAIIGLDEPDEDSDEDDDYDTEGFDVAEGEFIPAGMSSPGLRHIGDIMPGLIVETDIKYRDIKDAWLNDEPGITFEDVQQIANLEAGLGKVRQAYAAATRPSVTLPDLNRITRQGLPRLGEAVPE